MLRLKRRFSGRLSLFAAIFSVALPNMVVGESIPEGYPATYKQTLESAEKEGTVVIYANTENVAVAPILDDFRRAFPKIRVDYIELRGAELYSRVSGEAAAGALKADFVWSSSMDLQYEMVASGLAQSYQSPESSNLPDWARFEDTIYGITFEPVVFVYNNKLVSKDEMPQTRADLAKFLNNNVSRFKGKVTTYDPQRSGLGFFAVSHDAQISDDLWPLVTAFGATDTKFYISTGTMLEKISAGEHAIAYNIIGPYAYLRAQRDPNVSIVIPTDYTLIVSRIGFISKSAAHPNAARVFLDYLLSKRGQTVIANEANLFAIRPDVEGEATAHTLLARYKDHLKPVKIDSHLLDELEPTKRLKFFRKWDQSLKSGQK